MRPSAHGATGAPSAKRLQEGHLRLARSMMVLASPQARSSRSQSDLRGPEGDQAMSASGTKRTSRSRSVMSAFGGIADIVKRLCGGVWAW
jgi:hypothetical protein